jgi:hypothetical protein
MAETYFIINPTQHLLQIYDIVRILPGTDEEPSVTECSITNQMDLEAIKGVEAWGLTVMSEDEYNALLASLDDEPDAVVEEVVAPPEKISVRRSKSTPATAPETEAEAEPTITILTNS